MADTTKVREALHLAIAYVQQWEPQDDVSRDVEQRIERALAALDSTAQEGARPVTWMVEYVRTHTGEHAREFKRSIDAAIYLQGQLAQAEPPMPATITPLYTTPQPSPSGPVAIKPLDDSLLETALTAYSEDLESHPLATEEGLRDPKRRKRIRLDAMRSAIESIRSLLADPAPVAIHNESHVPTLDVLRRLFAKHPQQEWAAGWNGERLAKIMQRMIDTASPTPPAVAQNVTEAMIEAGAQAIDAVANPEYVGRAASLTFAELAIRAALAAAIKGQRT